MTVSFDLNQSVQDLLPLRHLLVFRDDVLELTLHQRLVDFDEQLQTAVFCLLALKFVSTGFGEDNARSLVKDGASLASVAAPY